MNRFKVIHLNMENMENIEYLKRLAKQIKKDMGIPHHLALDQIAREKGFLDWKDLLNKNNHAKENHSKDN